MPLERQEQRKKTRKTYHSSLGQSRNKTKMRESALTPHVQVGLKANQHLTYRLQQTAMVQEEQ